MMAEDCGRGPVVSYVPNEVCVVIAAERLDDPAAAYEAVRTDLNALLPRLRRQRRPKDALERDLTPGDDFWRALDAWGEPLRPLRRGDGQAPWAVLPTDEGATLIGGYRLGPDRAAAPDDPGFAAQQRLVRQVTNLLNWRARTGEAANAAGVRVVAVTPNWLTTPAHSFESPGSRPEPVAKGDLPVAGPGRFTFEFADRTLARRATRLAASTDPAAALLRRQAATQARLQKLIDGARAARKAGSGRVVVAVLDTCPTAAAVAAAAGRYPDNQLLQEVVADPSVVIADPLSIPAAGFAHLAAYLPNWREFLPALRGGGRETDQADHGLFVAGIVRDIAPRARLHVVRVLNDRGVGDLLTLVRTLAALPGHLLTDDQTRLIVNLSLTVDVPPASVLLAEWLPATHASPRALRERWGDASALLNRAHASIAVVVRWLRALGVLVVAAAGNGASGPVGRPEPAYPAAYDAALGVAAVPTEAQRPAQYSNRGDMVVFGNGVATLGGEGKVGGPDQLAVIPPLRGDWMDAVPGLFSAERLPLSPVGPPAAPENETGWVWWSGTSFATPIASAIAAATWEAEPGLGVDGVMQRVRAFATVDEATLEAAGQFDCAAVVARPLYRDATGAEFRP